MAMPKAQRIQQSITTRIKKLKEQNILTPKDFEHLNKRTHELYRLAKEANNRLAKEANKLEEIKKIIERK